VRAKPNCRMQNIYEAIASRQMMPNRTVAAGVLELSESGLKTSLHAVDHLVNWSTVDILCAGRLEGLECVKEHLRFP